jgi:phosphopantothenoylcysteine synthetase/decarboxylase
VSERPRQPVLYVIACGARPARDLAPFVKTCQEQGWDVCVIATPSALKFLDADPLANLTGHVVRHDYKRPEEPDVLPPADAMVVAPATFNTVNKWAYGNSDTLALGLLNEAIGLGLPLIAAPALNVPLAEHPVFMESVTRLRSWGVTVLFDPQVYPLPNADLGQNAADVFCWSALAEQIAEVRLAVHPDAGR